MRSALPLALGCLCFVVGLVAAFLYTISQVTP